MPSLMTVAGYTVNQKGSMFVCVEILRPSQPSRVMSSAVSLQLTTALLESAEGRE